MTLKLKILSFLLRVLGFDAMYYVRVKRPDYKRKEYRGTTLFSTADAVEAAAKFQLYKDTRHAEEEGLCYLVCEVRAAECKVERIPRDERGKAAAPGPELPLGLPQAPAHGPDPAPPGEGAAPGAAPEGGGAPAEAGGGGGPAPRIDLNKVLG